MSTQLHPDVETPSTEVPTQQTPVQQMPVQQPPVQQMPFQQPPVQQSPVQQAPVFDRRLVAGVVLIAFGVLTLLATLIDSRVLGLSILPMIGVLFIIWGLTARLPGLMIPGGILTGLGLGILLNDLAFSAAAGEMRGGIIVLGLGFGFLMILPLTWVISSERHWWALIPGGILSLVGIALLIGGGALETLTWLGRLWPVVPIVVGIILIWQMLRKR